MENKYLLVSRYKDGFRNLNLIELKNKRDKIPLEIVKRTANWEPHGNINALAEIAPLINSKTGKISKYDVWVDEEFLYKDYKYTFFNGAINIKGSVVITKIDENTDICLLNEKDVKEIIGIVKDNNKNIFSGLDINVKPAENKLKRSIESQKNLER